MVAVMKLKRILIIMLCLLITGCKASETEVNDKLDMQYKKYTQKLIEQREYIVELIYQELQRKRILELLYI